MNYFNLVTNKKLSDRQYTNKEFNCNSLLKVELILHQILRFIISSIYESLIYFTRYQIHINLFIGTNDLLQTFMLLK